MNQHYTITNLEKFVESTRVLVFDAFGKTDDHNLSELTLNLTELKPEEQVEIDSVLSQQEGLIIAKDFIREKTRNKKTIYIISEKKYMAMIESFNERLVSNMLKNLTQSGLLESAYDSELNDFIFWIKEQPYENKDQNNQAN
jgi:hypothetical protein